MNKRGAEKMDGIYRQGTIQKFALQDKRGAEKIISIWWFAILAVVATTVVIVCWMFYGSDINMRGIEADALALRVSDCLINLGEINSHFFDDNFDIYGSCSINQKIIENGNYFLSVRVYDLQGNLIKQRDWGIPAFEKECEVKKKITSSKGSAYYFPECSTREFYVSRNGENLKVQILGGSNNVGAYL